MSDSVLTVRLLNMSPGLTVSLSVFLLVRMPLSVSLSTVLHAAPSLVVSLSFALPPFHPPFSPSVCVWGCLGSKEVEEWTQELEDDGAGEIVLLYFGIATVVVGLFGLYASGQQPRRVLRFCVSGSWAVLKSLPVVGTGTTHTAFTWGHSSHNWWRLAAGRLSNLVGTEPRTWLGQYCWLSSSDAFDDRGI